MIQISFQTYAKAGIHHKKTYSTPSPSPGAGSSGDPVGWQAILSDELMLNVLRCQLTY